MGFVVISKKGYKKYYLLTWKTISNCSKALPKYLINQVGNLLSIKATSSMGMRRLEMQKMAREIRKNLRRVTQMKFQSIPETLSGCLRRWRKKIAKINFLELVFGENKIMEMKTLLISNKSFK